MLDSALGESNARDSAAGLREAGFRGSVVCVVEEAEAPALAGCDAVSAVVPTSAPVSMMMEILASVMVEAGDPTPSGAVCSVLQKDRTKRPAIERFIATAGSVAKDLTESLASEKRERLRELCATLKRGGWANGFPAFGDATRRVVKILDDEGAADPALAAEVDRLVSLCTRLRSGAEPTKGEAKDESKAKVDQAGGGGAPAPSSAERDSDAEGGALEQAA
jgi:hypothetical protein